MVTRHDYGKSEVNACLSVLVELMTILGEFRDSIVLVGGWKDKGVSLLKPNHVDYRIINIIKIER